MEPLVPAKSVKPLSTQKIILCIVLVTLAIGTIPLASWQRAQITKTSCLSSMRRVGAGLLMYAQDWDGRFMPPTEQLPNREIRRWSQAVHPYIKNENSFACTLTNIKPFSSALRHPIENRPVDTTFALNYRFWNTFSKGAFPTENLEIPERTALLVDAGPLLPQSPAPAFDIYHDIADTYQGQYAYPSRHGDFLNVVAADGHGIPVRVLEHTRKGIRHHPLYGRIGGEIYNWNGGHKNGETDRPPHE